jgi:hypothetical protein
MFSALTNVATGAADFNDGTSISLSIGGTVNGMWTAAATNSATDLVPTGATFALSAAVSEQGGRGTWYSEGTVGAFQSSVVLTPAGTADVTAPVCTVVTIAPITATTDFDVATATLTITCSDTGGSGVWIKGAFAQTALTTGTQSSETVSFVFTGASSTVQIPPYISGTLTVIGVFAVDNSGNAALYGSCGSISGYDSLGCGGGSSDASSVAVSLFAMVVLAIFALFY